MRGGWIVPIWWVWPRWPHWYSTHWYSPRLVDNHHIANAKGGCINEADEDSDEDDSSKIRSIKDKIKDQWK